MEDDDVIRQIKGGDTEAYAILVRKYHRQLLGFMLRLVGDRDMVEDLGQEVFLSVYKSLRDFDESRGVPFSAWLFIAARNRCVSAVRGRRPAVALEDVGEIRSDAGTGEDALLGKELRLAVEATLEQLPEPFRSTLLRSMRGDTVEEIAAVQRVAAGTVKSRLSRARERMRALLREHVWRGGNERV